MDWPFTGSRKSTLQEEQKKREAVAGQGKRINELATESIIEAVRNKDNPDWAKAERIARNAREQQKARERRIAGQQ